MDATDVTDRLIDDILKASHEVRSHRRDIQHIQVSQTTPSGQVIVNDDGDIIEATIHENDWKRIKARYPQVETDDGPMLWSIPVMIH